MSYIKKYFLLFFILTVCFSKNVTAFYIDGVGVSFDSFFNEIPKNEWKNLSTKQRFDVVDDYVNKIAVYNEAYEKGFLEDPFLSINLRNRYNQQLITAVYEYFVALPMVDSLEIDLSNVLYAYIWLIL